MLPGALGLSLLSSQAAQAREALEAAEQAKNNWIASPPSNFVPLYRPGLVVGAEAKGDYPSIMQPNQLWPREEIARKLLERVLTDLTGESNINAAMGRFIHPEDRVAIKVNGIAGQHGHTVAVNFELILPLVEAVLAQGVAPENIVVYEQYPTYLMGSRVNVRNWKLPEGVKAGTHNNRDCAMPKTAVFERIKTRYCRIFTDASAVIDMTMMKDHSICGFTGALKNITHGNIDNPHHHHKHRASPQIAHLYNHPIVQSRVRLHITDAFKIIYDKGPLDKDPRTRAPHGTVYAATDPVALDRIGLAVIDKERQERGLKSLKNSGRQPAYLEQAAELGIGLFSDEQVTLRKVVI